MSNPGGRHSRITIAMVALAVSAALVAPAGASGAALSSRSHGPESDPVTSPTARLHLGAADLPETRTVTRLAPGVTQTSITRGGADSALFWTAEVALPSTSPDPDAPASALSGQTQANAVADALAAAGVSARVEQVVSPQLADAGGELGFRVRVGQFAAKADGAATLAAIQAAGYASSVIYTGWDGDVGTAHKSTGPWTLEVITVDPKRFRGELTSTFGPDIEDRETTSELARASGALAATNGGYFVLDPLAGAPGDPAGAGVFDGKVLSEAVADRPNLVLDGRTNHSAVERLTWRGRILAGRHHEPLALSGIDRVPGLIRNCGNPASEPTTLALHDVTCTASNEIVVFTPQFGEQTPAGPGLEVVLDAKRNVTAVHDVRGMPVPAGGRTVQAIGSGVDQLRGVARVGNHLRITTDLVDVGGQSLRRTRSTNVVNGAPLLLTDGIQTITARRDGYVRPNDSNSFFYGFVHKRNPRTFGGVDARGRTILVTADGRQTTALGLSLKETADVAQSLGMVDALNLDGGGSTTMTVGGQVVNVPSDVTGERPVGDVVLVLPAG